MLYGPKRIFVFLLNLLFCVIFYLILRSDLNIASYSSMFNESYFKSTLFLEEDTIDALTNLFSVLVRKEETIPLILSSFEA